MIYVNTIRGNNLKSDVLTVIKHKLRKYTRAYYWPPWEQKIIKCNFSRNNWRQIPKETKRYWCLANSFYKRQTALTEERFNMKHHRQFASERKLILFKFYPPSMRSYSILKFRNGKSLKWKLTERFISREFTLLERKTRMRRRGKANKRKLTAGQIWSSETFQNVN